MNGRELAPYTCVAEDVVLGSDVRLAPFVNLYGCAIGDHTRLGAFVEVQREASIGRRCKISSHTFICSGVVIEDEVFVGHGVVFINDRHPRAAGADGTPLKEGEWRLEPTIIRRGASIGSGAVIMCGVEIGASAMIGAGALVTRNIPANAIAAGHPARILRIQTSDREGTDNAD
ncbi:MAG: N-acetyltransferase [Candidatus Binataceae bacterium]|nr:N-acetyltransferase [Candidatus Binataceae bacterium]